MSPDELSVAQVEAALRCASGGSLRRLIERYQDDPRRGVQAAIGAARARDKRRATESSRLSALYRLERSLYEQGCVAVAGIDEVGRGAIAGPLTAGACVLPPSPKIEGVNDSKQLTPAKRRELDERIRSIAVCCSVAHVTAEEIDAIGMTAALREVMVRAIAGLAVAPDHVVVDGRPVGVHLAETAVVKGDAKVAAIAAASIIAKVERDALMVAYANEHPQYGFEVNKGYGTTEHFEAVASHGLCVLHRRSFCRDHGMDRLF